MKTKEKRTWIVFANEDFIRHRDLLTKTNHIYWPVNIVNFEIGDIVYLFMSDTKTINYKLIVSAKKANRDDQEFWLKDSPQDNVFVLEQLIKIDNDLLKDKVLKKYGFNGGKSIRRPVYNKPELIHYIDSVFSLFEPTSSKSIICNSLQKKFIVVDLNTGSFLDSKIGHEYFNLIPNKSDGRFYGYCPPVDNIDIRNLGASAKDKFIDDVMVIYVEKVPGTINRKVIAFTDNATIHDTPQDGRPLGRYFFEGGKRTYCSYSIESDYIYDLRDVKKPYVIETKKYSNFLFRMQRFYCGKHPALDKDLIAYLTDYLLGKEAKEEDNSSLQEEIQNISVSNVGTDNETYKKEPSFSNSSSGRSVNRDPRAAKRAIESAGYKCLFDNNHKTFLTNNNVTYVEGHHLIPCTPSNTDFFWKKFHRNIDCIENIVGLCPNCHRRIHLGSKNEKEEIIEDLYKKQHAKLEKVGLKITLEDLKNLYNV